MSGRRSTHLRPAPPAFNRRLQFERLEERRLLATVNVLHDVSVVDGETTLREAIAATPAGGTVDFAPSLFTNGAVEIQLTNVGHAGEIVIDKNLTINGPGASLLTIRAFAGTSAVGDGARIFNIDDGTATRREIAISNLTLTGGDPGNSGGAIRTVENLSVFASTISGNTAAITGSGFHGGGIASLSGANLTVNTSTVGGNTATGRGGGIYSQYGTTNIFRSTISGNTVTSTGQGGGVYSSYATTNIDSSTIAGNVANVGGGVAHNGIGIVMTITNSTISGNKARTNGGGVAALFANINLRHSTITLNRADDDQNATGTGGGVFRSPAGSNITIDHTIVAGNTRGASTHDDVSGTVVATSSFNLIGVDTGLTGITNGTSGNQIGTSGTPKLAMLEPLSNNGGPTQTHAPQPGSPAIDMGQAGIAAPPANDQRGGPFARIADGDGVGGSRIDIGAYERQTVTNLSLVVDSPLDTVDGDYSAGKFTLREAIYLANGSVGANTITFAASMSGAKIELVGSELVLSEALTIDASSLAANVTIDANQQSRILNITATAGDFTLRKLTMTGGRIGAISGIPQGGGIRSISSGHLTLDRCIVVNNRIYSFSFPGSAMGQGVGIWAAGAVSLVRSTISGNLAEADALTAIWNGIGVFSNGDIALTESIVSENTSLGEVAILANSIAAAGAVTLTRSTVSNNDGDGVEAIGAVTVTESTVSGNAGTGIDSESSLTLTRSTVSGNMNGGIDAGGAITITQSTITKNHSAGNGGGIRQLNPNTDPLQLSIHGSIVADNTATGTGADIAPDPQTVLTGNYNLIGVGTGLSFPPGSINQTGSTGAPLNPRLAPLADYGGPTQTHAPESISTAIDAGDPSVVFNPAEFDARGAPFVRVFDGPGAGGARIDIGAHEWQSVAPAMLVVTTTTDELDYSNSTVSLREAINSANGNPGVDTIVFAGGLSGGTIMLGGSELMVGGEGLTIDARPLSANVTINAGQRSRIFHITSTQGNFTLAGLTLTGGRTTGDSNQASEMFNGGAIRSLTAASLTLDESIVSSNSTTGLGADGGGVWAVGTVVLNKSIVSGNNTAGELANGGGIFSLGHVTLIESTVSGNSTASGSGGGIYVEEGNATLTSSAVSGNSAGGGDGGGIFVGEGIVSLELTSVSGNSANSQGGGIRAGGSVTISRSTISDNSTTHSRGGGVNVTGSLLITNSTVSGNSSAGVVSQGGGVFIQGTATITQSTITNNHATQSSGGGVFQYDSVSNPSLTISGSIVAENTAAVSGADLVRDPQGTYIVSYSMVGTGVIAPGGTNIINDIPPIGALADNGGAVHTHAILSTVPTNVLIDAGNPATVFDRADYDNRGSEYVRVFDGDGVGGRRIDIGAYEFVTSDGTSALFGDYDRNKVVDIRDYVLWRNALATSSVPFAGADGDGDGTVDQDDYPIWRRNFGRTLPPAAAGAAPLEVAHSAAELVESPTGQAEPTVASVHVELPSIPSETVAATPSDPEQVLSLFDEWSVTRFASKLHADADKIPAAEIRGSSNPTDALLAWWAALDSETAAPLRERWQPIGLESLSRDPDACTDGVDAVFDRIFASDALDN